MGVGDLVDVFLRGEDREDEGQVLFFVPFVEEVGFVCCC